MTALELPGLNIDVLLRAICAELRLSDALHRQARERYEAVGAWLLDEDGLLAPGKPHLFPQGSLRLLTTVRPRGSEVYDLDIVCEFEEAFASGLTPLQLLDLLEHQLRAHQTYATMVRRKNRCIRLVYANDFYLDILPGFRDSSGPPGSLFVPDRQTRQWKASNPKGYAHWFETTEQLAIKRALDGLEPLPAPMAAHATPTLRRLVQLLKRFRDVRHEQSLAVAPISIVLTTLAGHHYFGETSEAAPGDVRGTHPVGLLHRAGSRGPCAADVGSRATAGTSPACGSLQSSSVAPGHTAGAARSSAGSRGIVARGVPLSRRVMLFVTSRRG